MAQVTELQPIMKSLRRSLIGVVALIDKALGTPPTYPTKDERRLLSIIRKSQVDLQALRQFIADQLT